MPVIEQQKPVRREASLPDNPELLINFDEPIAEKKTPLFRRPGVIISAVVLLILAILYTATIFFHNLTHESTDDAFIDAHIVSIAPKISGKISSVRVQDNELVKKG